MDCHVAANSASRLATATEYAGADRLKDVALELVGVVAVAVAVAVAAVDVAAAVGREMVVPRMASFSMM